MQRILKPVYKLPPDIEEFVKKNSTTRQYNDWYSENGILKTK
jgi:hypothetical protein